MNNAEKIGALNTLIKQLNEKDEIQYVGLHMLDMKFFRSATKQHKFDTKQGCRGSGERRVCSGNSTSLRRSK